MSQTPTSNSKSVWRSLDWFTILLYGALLAMGWMNKRVWRKL